MWAGGGEKGETLVGFREPAEPTPVLLRLVATQEEEEQAAEGRAVSRSER